MSSGSSKTNPNSVMKSEKTGAGIFNVGEKTIPTVISYLEVYGAYRFESSSCSLGIVLRFL